MGRVARSLFLISLGPSANLACTVPPQAPVATSTETGTTGDGDGDTGSTGDGDGDTGTTGDGDGDTGTTGDGDGDTGSTCDGDGDGDEVSCGNAVVEPGEECDEGLETMSCDGDCTYVLCGDGYLNVLVEQCDDGNDVDDDACSNDCIWNGCRPSGARARFDTLNLDTASGCWDGNPCAYDVYEWHPTHGQSFEGFDQAIACSGVATCVAHVGITTYERAGTLCQGLWDVYCDDVRVGSINTLGKACTGSAMDNTCNVGFLSRPCTVIELRATQDNDDDTGCCGGNAPDSMLTGVSAW